MPPSPSPAEEDDEFSFYSFSVLHFQGDATHTHITRRLSEPLLRHHNEGDALVRRGGRKVSEAFRGGRNVSLLLRLQACLNVWWLILRFMEDLPEPSPETPTDGARPVSRNLKMRQGVRMKDVVGLEEVWPLTRLYF